MNDFVDFMTNEGRTHGVFDKRNPALITAEAERWKEFNSYELENHNIRTRDKIKNEINNMSYELANHREDEMHAKTLKRAKVNL